MDIPDDHKLLVRYDNIQILQAFDTLLYSHTDDTNRLVLRTFVAAELKSKKKFLENDGDHHADVLNTYLDYLRSLEHEGAVWSPSPSTFLSPCCGRTSIRRNFCFLKQDPSQIR